MVRSVCRFTVRLKAFDDGWLCIDLGDLRPREVSLYLEKPVRLPKVQLEVLDLSKARFNAVVMITWVSYELDYGICIQGNPCIAARRVSQVRQEYMYWRPLELVVQDLPLRTIRLYELARFLRPALMAQFADNVIIELSFLFDRSESCQEVMKKVRVFYEYPFFGKLPSYLTRKVPEIVSDVKLIRKFEDFLFGLELKPETLDQLVRRGLITPEGRLTRLGEVVAFTLAPYLVKDDVIESLKNLTGYEGEIRRPKGIW